MQLCDPYYLKAWKTTIKEIVYSAHYFNISKRLQLNFNCD